eukprot:CAMPEP_0196780168 /NCGR_PEP_ID=MMETSP1104-20130614/7246_1 /TAXON_ID=33652 /ORGANISM="Cafeteria sp., Strain Caron Lab Isolate" /LENGTH=697 /DNA_ID=CAMNT_0042150361 /DNA_START=6 /DNA_END=2099 /DNA_ORIENTATION=-
MRTLAFLAVLVGLEAAELPTMGFEFEIANVAMTKHFAPATSSSGRSDPFQALIGHPSDVEQRDDATYIPETTPTCFSSPWLMYKARSSCQLCTIFSAHLYRETLSYMFGENRVSFATSNKEAYLSTVEDFELNSDLFEVTPSGVTLTPKLRSLFNGIVNRAADTVKEKYCTGEGRRVFGQRSRNAERGTHLWDPEYCSEALDTLRETFFERDLVMTMLLGCYFHAGSAGGQTQFQSPPMMCPYRVLCSCVSRCPDGGTPAGLGDGCSGDCVKCKSTAGKYGVDEMAQYFKGLEWSLANLDTRSEREDELLAESHKLQAERDRLNAEKERLITEFAEVKAALEAKTGTSQLELYTAEKLATDSNGTPVRYGFSTPSSSQLSCEWKPEAAPEGYPGTVVAAAGRPQVSLRPSMDFAVFDALDTETPKVPDVKARASLQLNLECTLNYEVATTVAMQVKKEVKDVPELASWPEDRATGRLVLNRPSPPPVTVATSITDRAPCDELRTAITSRLGNHQALHDQVRAVLKAKAPLMVEGQDIASWLQARAGESQTAYVRYMNDLQRGINVLKLHVFFLDNSVSLNSQIVASMRAQLEGASAGEEQLNNLEQELRDRVATATQQSYQFVQSVAAATLAEQLQVAPQQAPRQAAMSLAPATAPVQSGAGGAGSGQAKIAAALQSPAGIAAWSEDTAEEDAAPML